MTAAWYHRRGGRAQGRMSGSPDLPGHLATPLVTAQPARDRRARWHLRCGVDLGVWNLDSPDRTADAPQVLDLGDLLMAEVLGPGAFGGV